MSIMQMPDPEQLRPHEWPLRLLGLNADQVACIRGTLAHDVAMFKGYGLIISCGAFGWFVFAFLHGLLRWHKLDAALLALSATPMLLMIEAYNLATTIGVPGMHPQRFAARLVVVVFVFGGVLGQAADLLRDDVDAVIAANQYDRTLALQSSPKFQPGLSAAQAELALATRALSRVAELKAEHRKQESEYRQAVAERDLECSGATGKDGQTRNAGCGPKAAGWATEAQRLEGDINAIAVEIKALGDPQQAKASAQSRLDTLTAAIRTQAERESGGAGARLAALGQAARHDFGALLALAFVLGISMLPDIIAWLALSAAPGGEAGPEGAYLRLRQIERHRTDRQIDGHERRTRGAEELPFLEVGFDEPMTGAVPAGVSTARSSVRASPAKGNAAADNPRRPAAGGTEPPGLEGAT